MWTVVAQFSRQWIGSGVAETVTAVLFFSCESAASSPAALVRDRGFGLSDDACVTSTVVLGDAEIRTPVPSVSCASAELCTAAWLVFAAACDACLNVGTAAMIAVDGMSFPMADVVVTKVAAYVAASRDVSAAFAAAELIVVTPELSVDACNACRGADVADTAVEVCVGVFDVCAAVSSVIEFVVLSISLGAASTA